MARSRRSPSGSRPRRYGLIDVYVNYNPGGSWIVSCLSHLSPSGDADPEPWGDALEYRTKQRAVDEAKALADALVRERTARRSVVFCDGRDVHTSK